MRRRQNNPILTGEAGVGKTAVVEGFARASSRGDVPPALKDVTLRTLDVGLLQAGASMKGEFEQRLRQVIDEVQASPKPIILFIDEAHTLIGAGGAAGTGDAANLLKPALARGKLRTIARHHLGRVQEVLREGSGADPPLPDRAGRRARRGQGHPDDARHRLAAGEASPRADPGRGDRGRGAAVASLHPGAPAAGQGGQPAGHRLRPRRGQPARRAGGGGGLPAPHRGAGDRAGDHRRAKRAIGIDAGDREKSARTRLWPPRRRASPAWRALGSGEGTGR